ncbi:MAG: FprA family A-type flavoprotein, partial [bacterium]|nr:FprA family A-type flavoprotein [bacterium]
RIFDIVMPTEYGTTYNSYLIRGEKAALIEAVHADFLDEYLENVTSIMSLAEIDYLIFNHLEPDHSGVLRKLLEINPQLMVVTSVAGNRFAKSIANCSFNSMIVKDGDVLDLGGKILTFINAPFLHWPDTMFTYLASDKVLFPCDFLGSHYCEPRMFDSKLHYKNKYDSALKFYYEAIFSPFNKAVRDGLEKISHLELAMVCPSHGPILEVSIDEVIASYRKWSAPQHCAPQVKKVVIPYVSAYGCTEKMAFTLAEAMKNTAPIDVELINVIHDDVGRICQAISAADAVLFGSPTINRDVVKPIWDVLTSIDAIHNNGKLCGVFGSFGWSGESIKMMEERVKSLRLNLFREGLKICFVPSEEELVGVREYGLAFAKALCKMETS